MSRTDTSTRGIGSTKKRWLLAVIPVLAISLIQGVPAASATPVTPAAKTGPTSIVYVEVNSASLANVGRYTLASSGANAFDVAVIFAANINFDGSKAYLSMNSNVQATLDNAATQIKPLQQKGIKVVLSILGNHQGAGISNFSSQAAADAFALQVSDVVTKYGLDGVDLDDEYADYGVNGTPQPNASSFVQLLSALRADMPTKILSFYNIGPASTSRSYRGITAGSLLTYAWNPYYGSWSVPRIPGMTKSQLSPAAVDIQSTPSSTAASLATKTVSSGYGVFMTYNLPDGDQHSYVSSFAQPLYGQAAVYQ